jgi:hypothetical protein
MPNPKKNPQSDLRETKITNKNAVEAITRVAEAETTLDALPCKEMNEARKKRTDAKNELLAALPVKDEAALFRIEDYLVLVSPAPEKDRKVEFIRHAKPRLKFVEPEGEETDEPATDVS